MGYPRADPPGAEATPPESTKLDAAIRELAGVSSLGPPSRPRESNDPDRARVAQIVLEQVGPGLGECVRRQDGTGRLYLLEIRVLLDERGLADAWVRSTDGDITDDMASCFSDVVWGAGWPEVDVEREIVQTLGLGVGGDPT